MRFLRYFLGGFQALVAAFALMGFGAALIAFIQLNNQKISNAAQRTVAVENGGRLLVDLIGAAVFGLWFGRRAVRNFRDTGAATNGQPPRK